MSDIWDNQAEEQPVLSVSGSKYGHDDWVFCVQCEDVFQVKDLVDGDDGGCPKCGAGGLDQDVFSVNSDLASEEIREEYEQKRGERESTCDAEYVDEFKSVADDDWLFDGRED